MAFCFKTSFAAVPLLRDPTTFMVSMKFKMRSFVEGEARG